MQFSTTRSSSYRHAEYQRRLTVAVALSLLAHAFVLSLQFGLPGLGLPGLELPWSQRRPQLVSLSVALSNAAQVPDPVETAPQSTDIAPAVPAERGDAPHKVTAPAGAQWVPAGDSNPLPGRTASGAQSPLVAQQESAPAPGARAEPAAAGSGAHLITKDDTGQSTFSVPPAVLDEPGQTTELNANARPALAAAPPPDTGELAASADRLALEQEQARAAQKLAQEAAAAKAQEEQQLAREREERSQAEAMARQARLQREEVEKARHAQEMEVRRLEESRQRAEEEAQQQAAALALQQRAEQQRLEEQSARRARALEAERREELRLQEEASAKREAMEREARRRVEEAAAKERAEAEAAARQREQALAERGRAAEAAGMARNAAGGGLAGRALEQARKSDAAPVASPMPHQPSPAADPARRRSVLGRVDQDVGLMMYVESWRLKIERNGRLNYRQSLVDSAYTEPIVTVAVRSDGSVDDIVFHRSSGRPELDEAVRRIVRLNARYAAFPPELARRYDVIEIRRQWNFDDKLRLLDEVR